MNTILTSLYAFDGLEFQSIMGISIIRLNFLGCKLKMVNQEIMKLYILCNYYKLKIRKFPLRG